MSDRKVLFNPPTDSRYENTEKTLLNPVPGRLRDAAASLGQHPSASRCVVAPSKRRIAASSPRR